MRLFVKLFARYSLTALGLMVLGAVISVPYGFFMDGQFTLEFVFVVNFFISVIVLIASLVLMFVPVFLKRDKLMDHSTIGARYTEAREKKLNLAHEMLFVGLLYVIYTAIAEVVVWMIF